MNYVAFSEYFKLTGQLPASLQDQAIASSCQLHSDLFDPSSFSFGSEDDTAIETPTPVGYFPDQYCF